MSEEELKAFRNLNTFSTKYIVNKKASSENDIATMFIYIAKLEVELEHKDKEIERLNNKYNKALELLIDYNLPCEVDDFMNVHSDYCETHCGVDEEQYKRCWNKFIEWKIGSDKK